MQRRVLRYLTVLGCVAWSARALGCDPPSAATTSTWIDSDKDGLSDTDELATYGTSPLLADTDGDGISDYDEVVTHAFNAQTQPLLYNPRVADLPEVVVQLVGPPVLTLNLTTTEGETWTWSLSRTFQYQTSWTFGAAANIGFSNTVGGSQTGTQTVAATYTKPVVDAGARAGGGGDGGSDGGDGGEENPEVDVDIDVNQSERPRRDEGTNEDGKDDGKDDGKGDGKGDSNSTNVNVNVSLPNVSSPNIQGRPLALDPGGPNTVTLTSSIAGAANWTNTTSLTLNFSTSQTQQITQAVTLAQTYAQTHTISASGAQLIALLEVFNTGNLAFTISYFILSASILGPAGEEIPVGNLMLNQVRTAWNAYSLGRGGHQGPFNVSDDTITLEQFALLGNLSTLKLNVGTYELFDINGKPYAFRGGQVTTRTATIDIDYGGKRPHERYFVATNLDPAQPGVTMERVLKEILHIPYAADAERGLTSLRNVAATDSGKWTVEVRHTENGDSVTNAYTPPYRIEDIWLSPSDVVHLSWVAP
jgi:hypothetical protein